jgi:hypothetical protein
MMKIANLEADRKLLLEMLQLVMEACPGDETEVRMLQAQSLVYRLKHTRMQHGY